VRLLGCGEQCRKAFHVADWWVILQKLAYMAYNRHVCPWQYTYILAERAGAIDEVETFDDSDDDDDVTVQSD